MTMRSLTSALSVLFVASSLYACAGENDPRPDHPRSLMAPLSDAPVALAQPDDNRYIISFFPGQGPGVKAAVRAFGGEVALEIRGSNALAARLPDAALRGLERNPGVEFIEVDAKRYALSFSDTTDGGETIPYGYFMVQADKVPPGPHKRKICIIDSGYEIGHEDLQTTNVTKDDDSGTGDAFKDKNGHGTHVAGTIAALKNGMGVRGIVDNGSLDLHIIKVFTASGWNYSSSLQDAAQRCADAGSNVITMSLGGDRRVKAEDRKFSQLNSQGILSLAAAGNDGNTKHSYPASYNSVMSVAAVDANADVADFSQQTSQVEIGAPGVSVLSTVPYLSEGTVTVNDPENGDFIVDGQLVEGANTGTARGPLVDGGLCDIAVAEGTYNSDDVVLCLRGDVTFAEKVLNSWGGGAAAVVIYNNVPGPLSATMGSDTSEIPAVAISQADGQELFAKHLGKTVDIFANFEYPKSEYQAWDGTSMATPHASAVATLLWTYNAAWTNDEIRDALNTTAWHPGGLDRDDAYGHGIVQAKAALDYLLGGGPPPPPANEPPVASFSYSCVDYFDCTFDASASTDDGNIVSYSWSFGGTGVTASHTFPANGSYTVTLTVTDDQGATGSTTQTVVIDDGNETSLVISSVQSAKLKGRDFEITWTTNVPADSVVTFECCGDFSSDALVTSHRMLFTGDKNAVFVYSVTSTAADGTPATAGPFEHRN